MAFKIDLSHLFLGVAHTATDASTLFDKTNHYIQIAEQIGKAWGLSGPQKLESVKSMLLADLHQTAPQLAAKVSSALSEVSSIISVTVAVFNTISWAFVKAAPTIVQVVPESAPAVAAIGAAIGAAQTVEHLVVGV